MWTALASQPRVSGPSPIAFKVCPMCRIIFKLTETSTQNRVSNNETQDISKHTQDTTNTLHKVHMSTVHTRKNFSLKTAQDPLPVTTLLVRPALHGTTRLRSSDPPRETGIPAEWSPWVTGATVAAAASQGAPVMLGPDASQVVLPLVTGGEPRDRMPRARRRRDSGGVEDVHPLKFDFQVVLV